MARLLISTALAGLLAFGGAAMAQPDDHRGHAPEAGHDQAPPQAAARPAEPAPQARGHMGQGGMGQSGPRQAPAAQPAAAPQRPGHDMHGPDTAQRAPSNNAMRSPGNAGRDQGNAMRGNPGQRRDFSRYQRNFTAPNHFHAPASYRRPQGWYAHRWTFGEILPSLFWAPDYWLSDYYDYGLTPPPPGTVWVRDGSDALLIDRDSGEIIQVAYSVFY